MHILTALSGLSGLKRKKKEYMNLEGKSGEVLRGVRGERVGRRFDQNICMCAPS